MFWVMENVAFLNDILNFTIQIRGTVFSDLKISVELDYEVDNNFFTGIFMRLFGVAKIVKILYTTISVTILEGNNILEISWIVPH